MALDRFEMCGWLSVYYRQVAKASGFLNKTPQERWTILRNHVMADSPQNDHGRAEAIDGVSESERPDVLAWLEKRRQSRPQGKS
jgi:hypothetical protein